MKIYTRTGDGGETSLFGGGRVSKDHPRVEAYGTVDELSSLLGVAIAEGLTGACSARLALVQRDLFAIGASLATLRDDGRKSPEVPALPVDRIPDMEGWMDEAEALLPPLKRFILPGGTKAAAALHVARAVCRRAERATVELSKHGDVDEDIIRYLNRLSDLLFVLARAENRAAGKPDVEWEK